MKKTDFDIFLDFCNKEGYSTKIFDLNQNQIKFILESYAFKRYALYTRIEEFKTELKNNLPSWLRRFL